MVDAKEVGFVMFYMLYMSALHAWGDIVSSMFLEAMKGSMEGLQSGKDLWLNGARSIYTGNYVLPDTRAK